jgi:4-hydroxybenzoate polyprenyltransferase
VLRPQTTESLPDTEHQRLARSGVLRPYILLARLDRPIGWWLLFWPCAWGVALAGGAFEQWRLIAWMLLGAIAMRGGGLRL